MLTAAQLVTVACQIAKCPGYTQIAGQRLNEILVDLALDQNLDSIRRTITLNVQPNQQAYQLPVNFLRARECFYNVNGAVFIVTEYALEDFDALFTGPNNSAYPEIFTVDASTNILQFYPLPLVPLSVTFRYMDNTVELPTPDTNNGVPWFPQQAYLIEKLAAKMMQVTDDVRADSFDARADEILRRYLKLNNGNVLKTVQLDPRRFNNPRDLKATKLYP